MAHFFIEGKKKKQQVIKVKDNNDLIVVAKIAKCELTKNSILKDLDFSAGRLLCIVKDKKLTMKELWAYLEPKINGATDKKKDDKKSKKSDKNKKKNKKKSSVAGEKKNKRKKSSKKKKKKESNVSQSKNSVKKSDGLIHITRR